MTKHDSFSEELVTLIDNGTDILAYAAFIHEKLSDKKKEEILKREFVKQLIEDRVLRINSVYQVWYTRAQKVVGQLIPERILEFEELYKLKRQPKQLDYATYTIFDYMQGISVSRGQQVVVDPFTGFHSKFSIQLDIIKSIKANLESKLMDLEGILQSDLFNSELEVAEDLLKKNHIRASGAICGVVLEQHFKSVCTHHNISFRKKNPTIADYNEEMKKVSIIDVPTWRLIQRLGDIRNMSVHSKDREPTKDELDDLIRGCHKLISEVY